MNTSPTHTGPGEVNIKYPPEFSTHGDTMVDEDRDGDYTAITMYIFILPNKEKWRLNRAAPPGWGADVPSLGRGRKRK